VLLCQLRISFVIREEIGKGRLTAKTIKMIISAAAAPSVNKPVWRVNRMIRLMIASVDLNPVFRLDYLFFQCQQGISRKAGEQVRRLTREK
jgi:hypothetical protein